jgi:hypothetical protein
MLIVLRIVLPCEFVPGMVLSFGSVLGKARPVSGGPPEGDRSPVLGRGIVRSFESVNVGIAPVLFLVFVVGMAGKAEVGGPYDGREGRGIEAAMVYVWIRLTSAREMCGLCSFG